MRRVSRAGAAAAQLCVSRSRPLQRAGLALALALAYSGCSAWHSRMPDRNAQIITYQKPVRVQLHEGSDVVLTDARLERDTLYGFVQRGSADTAAIARRFAMSSVSDVRVREISGSRTSALVLGSALALRSGVYLLGALLFGGI